MVAENSDLESYGPFKISDRDFDVTNRSLASDLP
jgi:hypothetical protein